MVAEVHYVDDHSGLVPAELISKVEKNVTSCRFIAATKL